MLIQAEIEQLSYNSGISIAQLTKVCEILPDLDSPGLHKIISYSLKTGINIVIVAVTVQSHRASIL